MIEQKMLADGLLRKVIKMKWLAVVASFIFSYSTTEGLCPQNASNTSISNCNGSETNGSLIYIDFHKIRPPCTCTVIPSFEGDIQVTSEKTEEPCSTVIRIEASGRYYYFPCNHQMTSTQIISSMFQKVKVYPVYYAFYSREQSYHCLGFQENIDGRGKGNIRVFCGDTPQRTTSRTTETGTNDFSSNQQPSFTTVTDFGFHSLNATDEIYLVTSFSKYILVGISTCVLLGIFAVLSLVLALRIRKRNQLQENTYMQSTVEFHTDHGSDHIYDQPLPDNQQEVSQLAEQGDFVERQADSTRPVQKKMTEEHVAEIPIHAVPTKPKKRYISDSGGAVYGQVRKQQINVKLNPVRRKNQDGLAYIDVDHSNISHAKEQSKGKEKRSPKTTYAELKI